MPPYRDLAAYNDRAAQYESGRRGRLHHEIADRTASLAVATVAAPGRVLDVGCGTGYLLRTLALRYRDAQQLCGVDAAPQMISTASASARDDRFRFAVGVAEKLDYPDATFDLVVSTTSFDHWTDQQAGLVECARVLRPGGRLVLVDQFSRLAAADVWPPAVGAKPAREPRHRSRPPRGVLFPAMAPAVRRDHQRRNRDQAGLAQRERPEAAVEHLQMTDRAPGDRSPRPPAPTPPPPRRTPPPEAVSSNSRA